MHVHNVSISPISEELIDQVHAFITFRCAFVQWPVIRDLGCACENFVCLISGDEVEIDYLEYKVAEMSVTNTITRTRSTFSSLSVITTVVRGDEE